MKAKSIFLTVALVIGFAAPVAAAGQKSVSELSAIRAAKTGAAVEIVIVVGGDFSNDVFRLAEPERLVMDLTPVARISVPAQTEVNAGGVLRVRTGQFKPQVARLAFDLETPDIIYKIERTVEGLKITFRKEGAPAAPAPEARPAEPVARPEIKPEPPVPEKAEVKEEPRPAPVETPKPAVPPAPAVGAEPSESPSFFVQIAGGIGTFLQSESAFSSGFPINGKSGTAVESYKMKMNTPAALSAGVNIRLLDMPAKVGLSFEYWNFKSDATYTLNVPHPYYNDEPRTLGQTGTSSTYFAGVSAYSIFRLYAAGGLMLMAGPEVGYATGKFKFLDDFAVVDGPPYTEAQLSLQSLTTKNVTVSSLWAGLRIGIEYAFSRHLAGILNLRGLYFSPEIGELSNKLKLSQFQAFVGIQYGF